MTIKYACTHWGSGHLDAATFMDKIKMNGYDGVEINLADQGEFK
jgi:sugar phosphate isomerase/epimerase